MWFSGMVFDFGNEERGGASTGYSKGGMERGMEGGEGGTISVLRCFIMLSAIDRFLVKCSE